MESLYPDFLEDVKVKIFLKKSLENFNIKKHVQYINDQEF